jgi:hypothetical protein
MRRGGSLAKLSAVQANFFLYFFRSCVLLLSLSCPSHVPLPGLVLSPSPLICTFHLIRYRTYFAYPY